MWDCLHSNRHHFLTLLQVLVKKHHKGENFLTRNLNRDYYFFHQWGKNLKSINSTLYTQEHPYRQDCYAKNLKHISLLSSFLCWQKSTTTSNMQSMKKISETYTVFSIEQRVNLEKKISLIDKIIYNRHTQVKELCQQLLHTY